ncbi:MAG: ParB N-terminal domain-containing protein [Candidatus Caldarchaeum sp.]|nr:ParB N-terminal domain-containing protein [Candidatus Caldarchaeum sp.]MDW8435354.1 ParB N-terminal domain-containing protein [Candidatus Caldarchaeum sp.]
MSYGFDEFESKLGQFIYTMVMYERLRDYLLEKLKGKDRLSVRINLGSDKSGNQVFMDVILTAVRPQLLMKSEKTTEPTKKTLLLVLSNDRVAGEQGQIASEMERLILESLKWWHGYFGEKDRLMLNEWRSEKAEVLVGNVVGAVVEIPVGKVVVPPALGVSVSEEEYEVLAQFAEILGPVIVRPMENGLFELVSGAKIFNALVNKLGYEKIRAIVLDIDEEGASSIRSEHDEKTEKFVKTVLSR